MAGAPSHHHGSHRAARDHCLSPARPLGGRIVAEVLIGLLRADPTSYLRAQPEWEPDLPSAGPGFGLADLLNLGIYRSSA